ncbi:NDR1/HIN1-like protein 10 [Morus notabilis]|uniref:NDR1/HIN1-like protein 10 n=1 Tax=Morus notabilis TaxID=981085 RepID=UPI000CED3774|nr:NDR1/HIN1-like protein 10 [Morus notabilis]
MNSLLVVWKFIKLGKYLLDHLLFRHLFHFLFPPQPRVTFQPSSLHRLVLNHILAMVKIHPHHSTNSPIPPPPPPPQHRQPILTLKQLCCFIFQLSFCLCVLLCFVLIVLVVVFAAMFGIRSEVDVRVTDASLAKFDAADENDTTSLLLLSYDLSFNLTLRNPNRRIGVYYDNITAFAFYGDELLDTTNLAPFYQGHKTTNTLSAVFEGTKTVSVNDGFEVFSLFSEEERSGIFSIVAAIAVTVRTKYGKIKYRHSPTDIDCYLRVPLRGKSSYAFQTTQCGVVHIISYPNN